MKHSNTLTGGQVKKVIYHLCASEENKGSDSKYYQECSDYEVRLITEKEDVRLLKPQFGIYGIIANPVCTDLAGSGARWWKQKGQEALFRALAIVDACCRQVLFCEPHFWIIENPVGRLSRYLGKPVFTYQPYEYGDNYSKRTCLWGKFNIPKKHIVVPTDKDKIWKMPPSKDRAELRSICSSGFAKAFFEANR